MISLALATTLLYYACFVVIGCAAASLGPTLGYLAENTSSTLTAIGILFSARSGGFLIGASLLGQLYNRLPPHAFLGSMLLLLGMTLALTPLAHSLLLLCLIMLALGVAESLVDIGGNTLTVWLHGDKVGPYMNGLHFAFGVGATVVPLFVARATALWGTPAWAFWGLAIACMPLALLCWVTPSPQSHAQTQKRHTKKQDYTLIWLISLVFLIYVGVELGYGNWIHSYSMTLEGATETRAALINSLFWGAFTIGRLITIPLTAYLRPRTLLWGCLVGALFGLGIILPALKSWTAIICGSVVMGLSLAAFFPTLIAFSERYLSIDGRVMGFFFTGGSIGGMLIPPMLGFLLSEVSPQSIFFAVLGFVVLNMVLLFQTIRRINLHSEAAPVDS